MLIGSAVNAQEPKQSGDYGVIVNQAVEGQSLPIVVYVRPSDAHKDDLHSNMLRLKVSRIEFSGGPGNPLLSVSGLSPTIEQSVGGELKITSPLDKVVAKNGAIEISIAGGRKLLLPITSSLECFVHNADFLLTPKSSDEKKK